MTEPTEPSDPVEAAGAGANDHPTLPLWPPPAPPPNLPPNPPQAAMWPTTPARTSRPRTGRVVMGTVAIALAVLTGVGLASGWRGSFTTSRSSSTGSLFRPIGPAGGGTGGLSTNDQGTSSQASSIAAKVNPAVVDINTRLGYQSAEAAGTGMILSPSGEVLTNNHVVGGATSITATVVATGHTYKASVVGTDVADDVAVIQLHGASGLTTISTDSSTVSRGDSVVAIGNAGGVGGTPSAVTGNVTALNQTITASDQDGGNAEQLTGLIQTNAPIQAGDSGGPLVSTDAKVIGMDTAAASGNRFTSDTSVGYAIPIARAQSIAKQIESGHAGGNVQIGVPGFLGVEVAPSSAAGGAGGSNGSGSQGRLGYGDDGAYGNTTPPTSSGALVEGVTSGSPAESAGLAAGDTITSVDGKTVATAESLTSELRSHHPGDRVSIGWNDQSGGDHTATVTLATGPAA